MTGNRFLLIGGDSEIARYWRGEAAKLLAPLLHAAALKSKGIAGVVEWLDSQDVTEPQVFLEARNAHAAARQLNAVASLDDRNRGTTYMSAGSLIANAVPPASTTLVLSPVAMPAGSGLGSWARASGDTIARILTATANL